MARQRKKNKRKTTQTVRADSRKTRGKVRPERKVLPKGTVEALYAWADKHGYWKTLLAAVVLIFAFCIASGIGKQISP